jgi:superfamily II DNA/RNA helicase
MTLAQQLCDDPRAAGYDIVGAKTEALLEMLQHSLRGERVVTFAKFGKVIDLLERELRVKGMESVRITGKENWNEKFAAQTRFMSDGRNHCSILLMTKAGSRAINLQKSGFLIFFDLPWAYDSYRQLVGRLKRTGSTYKKLIIMRMMAVLDPYVAKQVGTELTIDHHTKTVVLGKKAALWNAITGDTNEVEDVNSDLVDVFKEVKATYRRRG